MTTASVLDFHTGKHYVHPDHSERTAAQPWIPFILTILLSTDSLRPFLEAQPSDVTQHVHVTQVNMNVNIAPPNRLRDAACACDASQHER